MDVSLSSNEEPAQKEALLGTTQAPNTDPKGRDGPHTIGRSQLLGASFYPSFFVLMIKTPLQHASHVPQGH